MVKVERQMVVLRQFHPVFHQKNNVLFYFDSCISNLYHLCYRYDNGTRDASYSIGLQGIKKEDYPMVVETIHKTFDKVIE